MRPWLALALVVGLGCGLRFVGSDRGLAAPVYAAPVDAAPRAGPAFHHFHPDETTLVQGALRLRSPLEPPLTTYGLAPLYLLRAAAAIAGTGPVQSLDELSPSQRHRLLALGRKLSALLSAVTVLLTFLLARRAGAAAGSAVLAALLVATAPVAIQQAHFYTVDSLFTCLCVGALVALLRALDDDDWRWYAVAGALAGVAAAVRLNGLLLVGVIAGSYALRGRGLRVWITRGLQRPVWTAAGAAVLALLLLQPYLLTRPELLLLDRSHRDLSRAVDIASGDVLRIWTLQDVGTIPYLHHWTDLMPLAVGWPLTLGFALAIGWALWRRLPGHVPILLWCGLYFALIGGLHTKPVRYLLPLLPGLAVLTAEALAWAWQRRDAWRWPLRLAAIGMLAWSSAYGIAFAGIYTVEDSRVSAARWIARHVPAGQRIGVETGAFTMRRLLDDDVHPQRRLNVGALFDTRGYLTCGGAGLYLSSRLQDVDYLALVADNRLRQFAAAEELLPGGASFYRHLVDGALGYEVTARHKVYPELAGLRFDDDGAEPSFVGFDHPTALVFRRQPDAAARLEDWRRRRLPTEPGCPDSLLQAAVARHRAGDEAGTRRLLQAGRDRFPHSDLVRLLQRRLRAPGADTQGDPPPLPVSWAAGLSLAELDLPDLAVDELRRVRATPTTDAHSRANGFVLVANRLSGAGHTEAAVRVYELATTVQPTREALNRLAYFAYRAQTYDEACVYWRRSLAIDASQAGVHANLGQTLAAHAGQPREALAHLREALRLDPSLDTTLSGWIEDLTASTP